MYRTHALSWVLVLLLGFYGTSAIAKMYEKPESFSHEQMKSLAQIKHTIFTRF